MWSLQSGIAVFSQDKGNEEGKFITAVTAAHGPSVASFFFFPQVFVSEVKQQVSDWHCTDVSGEGVREASWDLSLLPDPSLDARGLLKPITVVLKNSIQYGANEGKSR